MQWCVHDKHWSTWITLQLLFSIYINLQLPTYLNNFSIIKFTNVNNVSDINGWPLASNCPYGDHSGQRERLEIKYIIGLHQGEAKINIRPKINNFTAIQKLQQAKQALRSSTQS
jgi:hypothetical protein